MYKDKVIELRKKGFSVKDIAKKIGCSKSTACIYSQGVEIEDMDVYNKRVAKNKRRSSLNASAKNEEKWSVRRNEVIQKAKEEWETLKDDPEFMGFLGLYWGEGYKRQGDKKTIPIGIANSDPDIVRICKKFFDKYNPKYRCRIAIYPDQNKKKLVSFWQEITGVDKIVVWEKESAGEHRNSDSIYGTCYLTFSNFDFYHKIMTWLDCWKYNGYY